MHSGHSKGPVHSSALLKIIHNVGVPKDLPENWETKTENQNQNGEILN